MVGDRKFAQFLRFEAVLTSEDIMASGGCQSEGPFILNSTDFTLFLCFVQILVYNQNGNSKTKVTSRLQIKYYCFGEGDQEVAGISRMPFLKPNHLMSHRK